MERVAHEVLHIFRVYPCRADAHFNLGRIQLLRLHPLKRGHVYGKIPAVLRIASCDGKLFPHVSGQVFVSRLPAVRERIHKNHPRKLIRHFFLSPARKARHIFKVNSCLFRQGYGECLACGIDACHGFRPLDGAFREHVCLAFKFALIVHLLQRAQQAVRGILVKRPLVALGADYAEFLGKPVIPVVQLPLFFPYLRIGILLHLHGDKLLRTVTYADHPLDALFHVLGYVRRLHDAVFTVINLAVHDAVAVILYIWIRWNGCKGKLPALFQLCRFIACADMADGIPQLLLKRPRPVRQAGRFHSERPRHLRHPADHHLRVVSKIPVHGDAVCVRGKMYPIRLDIHKPVPFLEKKYVGSHFRPGVLLECRVWKPYRPHKLGPLCKVFPDLRRLLVHCALARHEGDDAAGTHLVQSLCYKVIMNLESELVISPVRHLVIAEGHVADRNIEKVILEIGLFKAADPDIRLRIKLSGDAPGNAVKLHAVQPAALHGFGQHSEEVSNPHGRLQHVALFKAHAPKSLVNAPDDHGACVVCVQSAFPRRPVLIVRQHPLQTCIFVRPIALFLVKRIRKASPADILR